MVAPAARGCRPVARGRGGSWRLTHVAATQRCAGNSPTLRSRLVEQVRAEAIVQTPKSRHDVGHGDLIRAMLLRIVGQRIAMEAKIDVATIDPRLAEEHEKANAT